MKHIRELQTFIIGGDAKPEDGGILIHDSAMLRGTYRTWINGEGEQIDHNLLPTQGIAYLLGLLGSTNKETAFYLAPFSGNVSPAANWTAANFASNATEITSLTEGFSNTVRPTWIPGSVAAGVIGNTAAVASFNIVCTSVVNIAGMGLLSSNVRGGTGGLLLSASRYGAVRVVNTGDTFEVEYNISLTDS
jgi:hypothetical protein